MNITHHGNMDVRHHRGFGHGLKPGTTSDINCGSCIAERVEALSGPTDPPDGYFERNGFSVMRSDNSYVKTWVIVDENMIVQDRFMSREDAEASLREDY